MLSSSFSPVSFFDLKTEAPPAFNSAFGWDPEAVDGYSDESSTDGVDPVPFVTSLPESLPVAESPAVTMSLADDACFIVPSECPSLFAGDATLADVLASPATGNWGWTDLVVTPKSASYVAPSEADAFPEVVVANYNADEGCVAEACAHETAEAEVLAAEQTTVVMDPDMFLWEREMGIIMVDAEGAVTAVTDELRDSRRDLRHIRCHYCVNGPNIGQKRSKWLVKCGVEECKTWFCQTHYRLIAAAPVDDVLPSPDVLFQSLLSGGEPPFVCLPCRGECCCSEGSVCCEDYTVKECATFGGTTHKCEKVRHRVYNTTKRRKRGTKRSGAPPSSSRPLKRSRA